MPRASEGTEEFRLLKRLVPLPPEAAVHSLRQNVWTSIDMNALTTVHHCFCAIRGRSLKTWLWSQTAEEQLKLRAPDFVLVDMLALVVEYGSVLHDLRRWSFFQCLLSALFVHWHALPIWRCKTVVVGTSRPRRQLGPRLLRAPEV